MWHENSNKNLPGMRPLYEKVAHILIVKLMTSASHKTEGPLFNYIWLYKLPPFSLKGMERTRYEGSNRAKESDEGFKPKTHTVTNVWPSFMVEIGVSNRLQQLQNDAWF
jgi:hypothetical protein